MHGDDPAVGRVRLRRSELIHPPDHVGIHPRAGDILAELVDHKHVDLVHRKARHILTSSHKHKHTLISLKKTFSIIRSIQHFHFVDRSTQKREV